jgi:hypothetical protein
VRILGPHKDGLRSILVTVPSLHVEVLVFDHRNLFAQVSCGFCYLAYSKFENRSRNRDSRPLRDEHETFESHCRFSVGLNSDFMTLLLAVADA